MAIYLHDKFLRVAMGQTTKEKIQLFLNPVDVRLDNWPQPDIWERVKASLDKLDKTQRFTKDGPTIDQCIKNFRSVSRRNTSVVISLNYFQALTNSNLLNSDGSMTLHQANFFLFRFSRDDACHEYGEPF